MWYEDAYRRHLCDMHIDDWDTKFLSHFSPEDYFKNLRKAKIQNAMLYFQSHVGYCYYPTKSGQIHKAFIGKEDSMKRLVDMCRENGISVTGYYSLIFNTWAHDTFPNWRLIGSDGKSRRMGGQATETQTTFSDAKQLRYGLCCPNNKDYRSFIFTQMEEMNQYFNFDGMFFDMLFWSHMCYCPSCQERWANEIGGGLPMTLDWSDPLWRMHIAKRREWMGEFAQTVTNKMKALRPGISVEHNFASAVATGWSRCCAEGVSDASDYTGGDLYGGIFEQSFTCKFYKNITKNQPFEYMFSRCAPNLAKHTIIKSDDIIKTSVFLTLAHHGATLVIDAIDPKGTMDARVYEKIGDVFDISQKYEPYLNGNMIEDVGIYYSLRSKFDMHNTGYSNHSCCLQTMKTLVENNISVGVTGGYHSISDYKLIIASLLTEEDDYDSQRLIDYVKEGGNIYISGADNRRLVEELLGGEIQGITEETVVYMSPGGEEDTLLEYFTPEYPMPFDGRAALISGVEGIATLTLPYTKPNESKFASIHSNPPGIATDFPAIVLKKYGKGNVIWSALPIENMEAGVYKRILLNLISKVLSSKEHTIISDAPKDVEVIAFRGENSDTVSAVLLNEEDEADTVKGFEIKLKSDRKPIELTILPNNEKTDFSYDGEYITFTTRELNIFDMYKINYGGF